jgi:hypothetical protein
MALAEAALEARARRAYERGRIRLGLRVAAFAVPMAVLSVIAGGSAVVATLGAAALAAVLAACLWRGLGPARGARLGLWAGLPPLVCPALMSCFGHYCGPGTCYLFPTGCLVGAVGGGLLLAGLVRRAGLGNDALAAAALVTALSGALGCSLGGAAGLAALGLGLAAGAAPLLLRRPVA